MPTLHRKNSPMPANERTGGSEGGCRRPAGMFHMEQGWVVREGGRGDFVRGVFEAKREFSQSESLNMATSRITVGLNEDGRVNSR